MQKINIMVGRFQPFTTGHYKCIETAKSEKGHPTVICMMDKDVDLRHPFPASMLIDNYNKLFANDDNVVGIIPVESADIVEINKALKKKFSDCQIASWTCGTDRYPSFSRMTAKNTTREKAELSDDFEVIEIPRDMEKDVSATKARECLLNDDKEGFFELIPDGIHTDEFYNSLKDQINKVYKNESLQIRYKQMMLEKRITRLEKAIKSRYKY